MIVNTEYLNGKLMVSYIDIKGKLQFKNYSWTDPQQWVVTHEKDQAKAEGYKTWDGKPVKKIGVRFPNRYTVYDFLDELPQEEKDDIFAFNQPDMFFCDIETEIIDGFPEAHLAESPITAVCIVNKDKVFLMGLKPLTDKEVIKMESEMNKHFKHLDTKYTIKWHHCEDEHELLTIFFNNLMPKMPVLTGWNFVGYDWVYLVTRARKLGVNPNVASPTGKLIRPWKKNAADYNPSYEELPKHRLVFDYMDIFNKWDTSIKIKESLRLDFISGQLLGVKKLEFPNNMNLKDAYHKDWYTYCLYNCIDTALVQLIHNKQRTFDIMLAMSNLSNIPIEDSLSAIRVTEGLFFKDYKSVGIVMAKSNAPSIIETVTESDIDIEDEELLGGYVKFPSIGLKSWITVFDFASLYPTTMIQFNIAPEAYRGIKINNTEAILNGKIYTIKPNDIVLLNNTVFENCGSKTKDLIASLFKMRKADKNVGLAHKKQKQLIKDYITNKK